MAGKQRGWPPRPWKTYEDLAAQLLAQFRAKFGLDRIEAKGVLEGGGGIIVMECHRHTKEKADQEELRGLAWRISYAEGTTGGVFHRLEFQVGVELVAKATNIIGVRLDPDSTPHDFVIGFLEKLRAGLSPEFPPNIGGRLCRCLAESEPSPGGEGESESHEAL